MTLGNIWIVDDNEIDVLIGTKTVERYDSTINVRSFVRAQDALEVLETMLKASEKLPDLIFLDLYMPLLDGWQFLRAFKTMTASQKHEMRIIVTSSTPNEKEIPQQTEFSEVVGHIIKPIDVHRLKEVREKFFA